MGNAARRSAQKKIPIQTVPETDTGGLVEYTKALERTSKELGKLHPCNFGKEAHAKKICRWHRQGVATVYKNTGLCEVERRRV